jgi:hypothetical protein
MASNAALLDWAQQQGIALDSLRPTAAMPGAGALSTT